MKTGGLADVAGALPKYINKRNYDVRVIMPKYMCMSPKWNEELHYVTHFYMDLAWRSQYVGILEAKYEGVTVYFVDNEYYFAGFAPYGEMFTDVEKFSFFSKAVLSVLPLIGFQPDIIHCNDWQTGLIPVFLNELFRGDLFFAGMKTIMTIHNLRFQGRWNLDKVKDITGLPPHCFTSDILEAYKDSNLLKGGIVCSDRVTTVSKQYAQEIQTPEYGEGLDGVIRSKSYVLSGIVNGIDNKIYDPRHDENLARCYGIPDYKKGKAENKEALQKRLGLPVDKHKMLIGLVSRLTDQKGLDLIGCCMEALMLDEIQLVVLGTGDPRYEEMFRYYAGKYPERVSANICYSEEISHQVNAACDAILVPSLFEPCGLTQLIAFRYGAVPIVRETGGLKDTVEPYNEFENTGTGFSFRNYDAGELLSSIRYAEQVYFDKPEAWGGLVRRGMKNDFSWKRSAKEYEKLYAELLAK